MTERHEVEVDTKLAELWQTEATNRMYAAQQVEYRDDSRYARYFDEAKYNQYLANAAEARHAARPLEAEYNQAPWSRFFLVQNNGGHIHSTMDCTTCFVTTQFAWLPTLSGLTEADAVAEQGEILCSICFPSAPAAWTNGVSKATQAERDARAAAKAERAAKKAAKALVPEDVEGGLVITYLTWGYKGDEKIIRKDRITTIAAAKTWLTDSIGRHNHEDARYSVANVATVAEALAARTDNTAADEMEAARKRAAKRS